jgi:hypothetical protein
MIIIQGKIKAEKILYSDGIGCTIWYEPGLCLDFDFEDIDDMISLLQQLKEVEPEIDEEK